MASQGGKEGKREGDWDRVGGSRDLDSYFMQIHGHSPPDKLIHCERGKKTSKTISILCWCCCWCRELCILFVVAVFLLLLFFFAAWLRWGWVCGVGPDISSSIISPEMAPARQISMRMPPCFYTNSFRDFPSLSAVLAIYYDGICPSSS